MKILIFEFATALGLEDPSIYAEGHAMLNGLLDDLKDMGVDYLISDKSNQTTNTNIARNTMDYLTSTKSNFNNSGFCNPIFLSEDLNDWITENIKNYDSSLVIAPEEDFILYNITRLIEENGVNVIGSASNAVMKCSDKFKMYESLEGIVPVIETEKVFFEDIERYKEFFDDNKIKVVKPADGVSCSGVKLINSFKELKNAVANMETQLPYFIVQDFVNGISASVSLLSNGKEAIPLSLNLQNVQITDNKIDYGGGCVPLTHKLDYEAKQVAKKAIESIDGLKGYIGVDLILGEKVHLVEINSRITTPYVALKDILNFNLGKAIINSCHGNLPDNKIVLDGKIAFKKKNNSLKIKKIL